VVAAVRAAALVFDGARLVRREADRRHGRDEAPPAALAFNGGNLGLLGYFKYGGFLTENFAMAMGAYGVSYTPAKWDIVLPVGISFYTFQTMSYTLDVYFRRSSPAKSFLDFALFVTSSRNWWRDRSLGRRICSRSSPRRARRRRGSSAGD
jgi:hypothetical protein